VLNLLADEIQLEVGWTPVPSLRLITEFAPPDLIIKLLVLAKWCLGLGDTETALEVAGLHELLGDLSIGKAFARAKSPSYLWLFEEIYWIWKRSLAENLFEILAIFICFDSQDIYYDDSKLALLKDPFKFRQTWSFFLFLLFWTLLIVLGGGCLVRPMWSGWEAEGKGGGLEPNGWKSNRLLCCIDKAKIVHHLKTSSPIFHKQ